MSENRCKMCRKVLARRRSESDHQWRERPTCSRSCGAKYGRRQREDYVAFQPHRCLLDDCDALVPRIEGEHDSDYRRRRYCCTAHSDIGRVRTILAKPSGKPPRECACGCGVAFVPRRHTVRFATKGCANRSRRVIGPRPTKVCQCGCGESFERPVGMSSTEWNARRFADRKHRDRGQWHQPGAARAGKRTAPRPVPSRDRKKATERLEDHPVATPAQEAPKPTPRPAWRPPVPVVEHRSERVTRRPSFGLTRRSISP